MRDPKKYELGRMEHACRMRAALVDAALHELEVAVKDYAETCRIANKHYVQMQPKKYNRDGTLRSPQRNPKFISTEKQIGQALTRHPTVAKVLGKMGRKGKSVLEHFPFDEDEVL